MAEDTGVGPTETFVARALSEAATTHPFPGDNDFPADALRRTRLHSSIATQTGILKYIAVDPALRKEIAQEMQRMVARRPEALKRAIHPESPPMVVDSDAVLADYVDFVSGQRRAIERIAEAQDLDMTGMLMAEIPTRDSPDPMTALEVAAAGHGTAIQELARQFDDEQDI